LTALQSLVHSLLQHIANDEKIDETIAERSTPEILSVIEATAMMRM
jgi:hypothetical protein